jgi:hypothetical protein
MRISSRGNVFTESYLETDLHSTSILSFSQRILFIFQSTKFWYHVDYISEEHTTSIFREDSEDEDMCILNGPFIPVLVGTAIFLLILFHNNYNSSSSLKVICCPYILPVRYQQNARWIWTSPLIQTSAVACVWLSTESKGAPSLPQCTCNNCLAYFLPYVSTCAAPRPGQKLCL